MYLNLGKKSDLPCEKCGKTNDITWVGSMTMYPFDGEDGSEDDPNKPISLCKACEEDHVDYWKERWDEYYSGLGV